MGHSNPSNSMPGGSRVTTAPAWKCWSHQACQLSSWVGPGSNVSGEAIHRVKRVEDQGYQGWWWRSLLFPEVAVLHAVSVRIEKLGTQESVRGFRWDTGKNSLVWEFESTSHSESISCFSCCVESSVNYVPSRESNCGPNLSIFWKLPRCSCFPR